MPWQIACAAMMALLTAWSGPVRAATRTFALDPSTVTVGFRAYGLGLLPINGHFTRFRGTLTLDDQNPAVCDLALDAESASLAMPSASMTADALGPDMLDVTKFPDFRINGHCAGATLPGTLLLHGISKPLLMTVTSRPGQWEAAGPMRRAEWGMGAKPMLAGPEVQISITAGLPAGFRTAP